MPLDSSSDYLRPRRNTRSLDLDDSAKKAAAWVWHLHDYKPGITTEGRFISTRSRRKSSSSYDRKSTRFQQEAAAAAKLTASEPKPEKLAVWDCGSKLYDTFELISFSNRLDRSLMETPAPVHEEHQDAAGAIVRIKSLPGRQHLSSENSATAGMPQPVSPRWFELSQSTGHLSTQSSNYVNFAQKVAKKWASIGTAVKMIKEKVLISKQLDFLGCKSALNAIDPNNKPLKPIIKIKAGELDKYMRSKDDLSQVKNNQEANWKDSAAGSTVKRQIGEPTSRNRHQHLHHHIHHHHHHHVHHNLASD